MFSIGKYFRKRNEERLATIQALAEETKNLKENFMFVAAPLVNLGNYIIPTDSYVTSPTGAMLRIVQHKDDIIKEVEEPIRDVLKKIDFDASTVICVLSKAGDFFAKHYHEQQEELYIIRGAMDSLLIAKHSPEGRIKFREGDYIKIPPLQVHAYTYVAPSITIAVITPRVYLAKLEL